MGILRRLFQYAPLTTFALLRECGRGGRQPRHQQLAWSCNPRHTPFPSCFDGVACEQSRSPLNFMIWWSIARRSRFAGPICSATKRAAGSTGPSPVTSGQPILSVRTHHLVAANGIDAKHRGLFGPISAGVDQCRGLFRQLVSSVQDRSVLAPPGHFRRLASQALRRVRSIMSAVGQQRKFGLSARMSASSPEKLFGAVLIVRLAQSSGVAELLTSSSMRGRAFG
jgi:hypothetical protein